MYTLEKILKTLINDVSKNRLHYEETKNKETYTYELDEQTMLTASVTDRFAGIKRYEIKVNDKQLGFIADDEGMKAKIFRLLEKTYLKTESKTPFRMKATKTFEQYVEGGKLKMDDISDLLDPLIISGLISVVQMEEDAFNQYDLELEVNSTKIYINEHLSDMFKEHMLYMTANDFIKFLGIYKKKFVENDHLDTYELNFLKDNKIKYTPFNSEGEDIEKIKKSISNFIDIINKIEISLRKIEGIKSIEYYIIPFEIDGNHSFDMIIYM